MAQSQFFVSGNRKPGSKLSTETDLVEKGYEKDLWKISI